MSCDDKRQIFQDRLSELQQRLQAELSAIATDAERRAQEISDDFEADNDLAAGVGAAAGTAVGGLIGGPVGAVAGGGLGKVIGSLFTLEIGMRTEKVSLDVPQVTMETQDFSFDLPAVVMRDTDISFDFPTVRMTTVRGPDIPEIETYMGEQCVDVPFVGRVCADVPQTRVTMKPTYYDKPEVVMETQRIVIGLPNVEMQRVDFKMDVPRIELKQTEFSADFPYVTLRFIKDAGKRTAALAAALAQQAQDAGLQKQIAFRERLKTEIAPLAVDMFACFRTELLSARSQVQERFERELSSIAGSLSAMKARGIPEDDNDYVAAKALLDDAMLRQAASLNPLEAALVKLDESAKATLEQFLGAATKSKPVGGLIRNVPVATKDSKMKPRVSGLIAYYGPEG